MKKLLFIVLAVFGLVYQVCGQSIIGGQFAGTNPGYVVSIHSGGTTGFKGAGVILDSRTILTAGHVVDQFENNASSLEVRAGHQNRSVGTQIVAFTTITLHPNYTLLNNDGVADFDLAIVKLSEDLVFDDKVKSIEIARSCIF